MIEYSNTFNDPLENYKSAAVLVSSVEVTLIIPSYLRVIISHSYSKPQIILALGFSSLPPAVFFYLNILAIA